MKNLGEEKKKKEIQMDVLKESRNEKKKEERISNTECSNFLL